MATYTIAPAQRDNVSIIIGIAAPSGAGKTYSALRIARGMAGPNGRILGIDTESGRMLHYAPPKGLSEEEIIAGENANPPKWFRFDHVELHAPFLPGRYAEIVAEQDGKYDVIAVDSWSHSWAGEGGMLDWQEEELQRLIKDSWDKADRNKWSRKDEAYLRDSMKSSAWVEPKRKYKAAVQRILQARCHVIFCMRAEEKLQIKKEGNKVIYIPAADRPLAQRWIPICCHNPEFMYELTVSFVFAPDNGGVPVPIKIQEQHIHAFPDGQRVNEETGRQLAAWAKGAHGPAKPQQQPRQDPKPKAEKAADKPAAKAETTPAVASELVLEINKGSKVDPCADIAEWESRMLKGIDLFPNEQCVTFREYNRERMALYAEKHPAEVGRVVEAFQKKLGE